MTPRQTVILAFITAYIAEHKLPPTLMEIATHFGMAKVTAHEHVNALVDQGRLERIEKHHTRNLRVVTDSPADRALKRLRKLRQTLSDTRVAVELIAIERILMGGG